MTSKLLTLLTQHVKNVHEKICGLQCRICEYASESQSDVHHHVKAVHLKIMNLKCDEIWRLGHCSHFHFLLPIYEQTFCVLPCYLSEQQHIPIAKQVFHPV